MPYLSRVGSIQCPRVRGARIPRLLRRRVGTLPT